MRDGFLVFYFVLIGLTPSLLIGLRIEKFTNKVKSLEEAGVSWRKAAVRWLLPSLILPVAWAMLCVYLTFNPESSEVAPFLLIAVMSSCITLSFGVLIRPTCKLVCLLFERADKWLYGRFP